MDAAYHAAGATAVFTNNAFERRFRDMHAVARRALIYLGRAEEALSGIPEPPDLFTNGGVYWAQRAAVFAHSGRGDEGNAIVERFFAARDLSKHGGPHICGRAPVLAGCRGRGAPLHTEAGMIYNIGRLCGGAAMLQGDAPKAQGYYQQALDVCTRAQFRPELALTRLEIAELLLEHVSEERPEALEHPDFAIAEFREMKMQPALERALKHKGLLGA